MNEKIFRYFNFIIYFYLKFLFEIRCITILTTLLLAYLKIYPLERRLILFLLPILFIVITYPLDNLKKNIISLVSLIISIIFFGYGYINFSKHYISKNISYLRQDVKPLLQKIINKDKNENVYVYYGAISTYCYYSLLYNIPKNVHFAHYPENENLSEIFLQQDIKNLPKGIYYLLFIKGTSTYEKDINFIEPWLKSKYEIIETNTLKSTKLIKIKIN